MNNKGGEGDDGDDNGRGPGEPNPDPSSSTRAGNAPVGRIQDLPHEERTRAVSNAREYLKWLIGDEFDTNAQEEKGGQANKWQSTITVQAGLYTFERDENKGAMVLLDSESLLTGQKIRAGGTCSSTAI